MKLIAHIGFYRFRTEHTSNHPKKICNDRMEDGLHFLDEIEYPSHNASCSKSSSKVDPCLSPGAEGQTYPVVTPGWWHTGWEKTDQEQRAAAL
jgi:hypothetical protein